MSVGPPLRDSDGDPLVSVLVLALELPLKRTLGRFLRERNKAVTGRSEESTRSPSPTGHCGFAFFPSCRERDLLSTPERSLIRGR